MRKETLDLVRIIFSQEGIAKRIPSDRATLVAIRLIRSGYSGVREEDIAGKTAEEVAKKLDPKWFAKIFRSLLKKSEAPLDY